MRPKTRERTQHGGPPGWLEESDPAGWNLCCDGRSMPPSLTHRAACPRLELLSCKHTPLGLLAVHDLTRDGRLSTYDESVLKLSKVSFWGKCARTGHPLKLPSLTKLPRLGHFPPASQAGRLAEPVFYTISFLWLQASGKSTVVDVTVTVLQ
jgi:hypothetical protein